MAQQKSFMNDDNKPVISYFSQMDHQVAFTNDDVSPMSRYFDGDSVTSMSQRTRRPPQFFGPPFVCNQPTTLATKSTETTESVATYEPPPLEFVSRPKPSEISCAASVESKSTDHRQSPVTNTRPPGLFVRQNEVEQGSVPVVIYVDLSGLKETKKGRSDLFKPSSTSNAQTNRYRVNNHWGSGGDNRRRGQRRNN